MSPAQRTKVLVIIPTLDVGGAEMDLLRNLPRLDSSKFEIVVFTFLARGTLAPQLAATGIEIVGPFAPLRWHWFGNLRRIAFEFPYQLALLATRSMTLWRDFVANMRRKRSGRRIGD